MVDPMDMEIPEEVLPNDHSDQVVNAISGITESESEDADRHQLVTVSSIRLPSNVLVNNNVEGLLFDQDSHKTTRIIIHNPSLDVLKNGSPTITFNSLNRSLSVPEKNTINFDPSAYDQVLPVRCRNVRGELHKNKFGSGNRGRSILANGGQWFTPSEFEALGGRANSKDWKRSIRYGGRTLQFLIEQGILRPHATACTCGNCCDDNPGEGPNEVSSGPIRLFTPYKRRKRKRPNLKVAVDVPLSSNDDIVSAPAELEASDLSSSQITQDSVSLAPLISHNAENTFGAESVIVSPESKMQAPKLIPTVVDFAEQKQWWQLEEMVKNTVRQVVELQKHIETVKQQCIATREAALQDLRNEFEQEKKEAITACRLEAQLALSRATASAKAQKDIAVQEAIRQTELEMQEKFNSISVDKPELEKHCANCGREALSECTGCRRVSYCGSFCQRKDWMSHRDECGEGVVADCSELPDSDDPTN